jgi:hypothetical protein
MAGKSDFDEQEWDQLHKGVTGAGLLVSLSDKSFFDTFKEAGALAKHMAGGRQSQSQLVKELAQTGGTGFGLGSTPDKVESETLESLRAAKTALEQKAPDELPAYREFVLDVARSVGQAAGGGDDAEAAAVQKISSALGE